MEIDLAMGFVWFSAFLFSTTVHEAMHGLVAWKCGDPTAYHGGQVSLSPVPHVRREPIGMLVLPLLTSLTQGWVIGWASVPYDPLWAERYPRRAALMAAAGPAGNFLLAALALAMMRSGLALGWFVAPETATYEIVVSQAGEGAAFLATALSVMLVMNTFLGVFNMLPFPPLDGCAVLKAFLPERYAARLGELESSGAMSLVGLVIAWQVFPLVTDPLFSTVLRIVHPGESYS